MLIGGKTIESCWFVVKLKWNNRVGGKTPNKKCLFHGEWQKIKLNCWMAAGKMKTIEVHCWWHVTKIMTLLFWFDTKQVRLLAS